MAHLDEPLTISADIEKLIGKMRTEIPTAAEIEARKDLDKDKEDNRKRAEAWDPFRRVVGRRYEECRLTNFDCTGSEPRALAVQKLDEFARNFESNIKRGAGIVLLGPRGTGKDHLAVATVRECVRHAFATAAWVDGQSLFSEFRDRISNDESEGRRIRELISPQILVISDPVPQDAKLTEYQQGILWQVIDGRYRQLRSTWITANAMSEAELCSKMGAQLVDRIVGDAMVIMTTGWKSYRTPAAIVK